MQKCMELIVLCRRDSRAITTFSVNEMKWNTLFESVSLQSFSWLVDDWWVTCHNSVEILWFNKGNWIRPFFWLSLFCQFCHAALDTCVPIIFDWIHVGILRTTKEGWRDRGEDFLEEVHVNPSRSSCCKGEVLVLR